MDLNSLIDQTPLMILIPKKKKPSRPVFTVSECPLVGILQNDNNRLVLKSLKNTPK